MLGWMIGGQQRKEMAAQISTAFSPTEAIASSKSASVPNHRKSNPVCRLKQKKADSSGDGELRASKENPLSPKLRLLEVFYEGLEVATSLLSIRRKMCTFRAACKIVESLSKRRFLLKHLAQIKHIFSEVLQLEYVRCVDSDSFNGKWDLRIILLSVPSTSTEAGKNSVATAKGMVAPPQKVDSVQRRKAFHARLVEFAAGNPEKDEVPEDPLPQRPVATSLPSKIVGVTGHLPVSRTVSAPINVGSSTAKQTGPEVLRSSNADAFAFKKASDSFDDSSLGGTPHFPPHFKRFFSIGSVNRVVPSVQRQDDDSWCNAQPACKPEVSTDISRFSESRRSSQPLLLKHSVLDNGHKSENSHSRTGFAAVKEISTFDEDKFGEERLQKSNNCRIDSSCSLTPTQSLHSTPKSQFSTSSQPVHTPPFCSPSRNVYARNSPVLLATKGTIPSRFLSPGPAKGQATVRALHFNTPTKSSDASRPTSVDPLTPSQKTPPKFQESTPVSPATPLSKSSNAFLTNSSQVASPVKHLKSRSLKFGTPNKRRISDDTSLSSFYNSERHISDDTTLSSCYYSEQHISDDETLSSCYYSTRQLRKCKQDQEMKPLSSQSSSKPLLSSSPSTPLMSTPSMIDRTPDHVHSPSKRTKRNRVSLFSKDGEDDDVEYTEEKNMAALASAGKFTASFAGADVRDSPVTEDCVAAHSNPESEAFNLVSESDLDIINCLPAELVQSVRDKERRLSSENSIEFVKHRRRQQMLAGVPKLFNQLRLTFQALHKSVLSRTELITRVLSSNPDITDKGEVEEKLELLAELASDWISARASASGDIIYRINKSVDIMSVQRRLLMMT